MWVCSRARIRDFVEIYVQKTVHRGIIILIIIICIRRNECGPFYILCNKKKNYTYIYKNYIYITRWEWKYERTKWPRAIRVAYRSISDDDISSNCRQRLKKHHTPRCRAFLRVRMHTFRSIVYTCSAESVSTLFHWDAARAVDGSAVAGTLTRGMWKKKTK